MHAVRLMAMAWLILAPALAAAQTSAMATATSTPNPLDPRAPVPTLPSTSVLDGYASYQPAKVSSWRQANDDASSATTSHAGHVHGQPAPASTQHDAHAEHMHHGDPGDHESHAEHQHVH